MTFQLFRPPRLLEICPAGGPRGRSASDLCGASDPGSDAAQTVVVLDEWDLSYTLGG